MQPWRLDQSGPKTFILATDGAFTPYHPQNDQVWECCFDRHGAHPFCLRTTYNLRARSMELFPSFLIGNTRFSQPGQFHQPPVAEQVLPDSIRIRAMPVPGCTITFEILVIASDVLVGGIEIQNNSDDYVSLTLELAAVLTPMRGGVPTHPDRDGINQILSGDTDALSPVLFMTGGPAAVSSPYPALSIPVRLNAYAKRELTWALATGNTRERSLDMARKTTAKPWRQMISARAMHHAARTIRVRTGNPDWDMTFALAQIQAQNHWVRLPESKEDLFLRARLPDSPIQDQQRLNQLDDLTVLEAVHLAQVLLPANPDQVIQILENILARMEEEGRLPSTLNGPMSPQPFKACPLIAGLFLQEYEITQDPELLAQAFPKLLKILSAWLPEEIDLETDPVPAWEDPRQLQFDTGLFTYDIWSETGRGLDIQLVESPALLGMLYLETTALQQMAKILGEKTSHKRLKGLRKSLKTRLQATWNTAQSGFAYRDIESRCFSSRELYYPGRVQEELNINKVFLQPQRLHLQLTAADDRTRALLVHFVGEDAQGQALEETFKPGEVRWVLGRAHLTTRRTYTRLHTISIKGLKPEDRFLLETADYSQPDLSCLLPIRADAASEDQVRQISNKMDPEADGYQFGLPETWQGLHPLPDELPISVNVLWNSLIIQGLARSGERDLAAALFTNLMHAITAGLHDYAGFFPFYNSKTGQPGGARNALAGLAPLGLMLELAGIRLLAPDRVALWGSSPFPWVLEVHWQGLSIRKDGSQAVIMFPDGTTYEGDTEKPLIVTPNSN
ncbi:glycoside hydrolase family 116 protein [bacterium]|nr:glycoside hydrolase family 116 protein [bacterium]